MTAHHPSLPPSECPARSTASKLSRRINVAISTAAIPAVIASSIALAQSAAAVPGAVQNVHGHALPMGPASARAAVVPASQVPAQIPSFTLPANRTPATYTVRAGDTISGIASRHGLDMNAVLKANSMNPSTIIYPGQKIRLSGSAAPVNTNASKTVTPKSSGSAQYIVKGGDTLSGIAARHGVSLSSLFSANNLSMGSVIYPGQKINIGGSSNASRPAPTSATKPTSSATYTVKAGDTLGAIAARSGVSLGTLLSSNGLSMTSIIHPGQTIKLGGTVAVQTGKPAQTKPAAPAGNGQYTIRSGDTLGAIAGRHGVSLTALLNANRLSATTMIHPGQKLTIPGKTVQQDAAPTDLVPSTFLHYTYPEHVVSEANRNKQLLNNSPAPTQAQMRSIVADTARSMGVDPSLALAISYQESGFNQRAVSPANAIGAMQVIPMSGEWASDLVGRKLNLLDPYDNATAGVAILRSLIRTSPNLDTAIASYYQGQYSVTTHGMFSDTRNYVAAIKAHQKNFR